MKTFKLDETGDLIFDGHDFIVIEDIDEVIQSLQTRLQIRLGEFFLDEFTGLSWDNIFSKPFVEDDCRADIISCLSQDDRVKSIDSVSFAITGRTLYVDVHLTLKIGNEIDLKAVMPIA